ncbi:cytochrome c maturation protein CcmE [Natronospora cellulosivora (SeqCode)]
MHKKQKIIIALIVIAIGFSYLIITGLNSFSRYFLTVEELFYRGEAIYNQEIQLSGHIVGDSITWDSQKIKLKFELQEEKGENKIPVVYQGIKPNNFQDGQVAIVKGKFINGEYIDAHELLMQCPSRYEASDFQEHPDEIE